MNRKVVLALLIVVFLVVIVIGFLMARKEETTSPPVPQAPTPAPIDVRSLTIAPVSPYPNEPKGVVFQLGLSVVIPPGPLSVYSSGSPFDAVAAAASLADKLGATPRSPSESSTKTWRGKDVTITTSAASGSLFYVNDELVPQGVDPTPRAAAIAVEKFLDDLILGGVTQVMTLRSSKLVPASQRGPGAKHDEPVVSLTYDVAVERKYPVLSVPPLSPAFIATVGSNNTIRSLSVVARALPGGKIRDTRLLSRDQVVSALQRGLGRLVFVDPGTDLIKDWANPPAFSRVLLDRAEVRYAYYRGAGVFAPVFVLFGSAETGARVAYVLPAAP